MHGLKRGIHRRLTQLIILACAACGPPRIRPEIFEYAHITSAPTPIHT